MFLPNFLAKQVSTAAMLAKAVQEPQEPWLLTGVTRPRALASYLEEVLISFFTPKYSEIKHPELSFQKLSKKLYSLKE